MGTQVYEIDESLGRTFGIRLPADEEEELVRRFTVVLNHVDHVRLWLENECRAYAAVATLAVVFVGDAIGGIAQGDFSGWLADALSLLDLVQASIDAIHWIFGEE